MRIFWGFVGLLTALTFLFLMLAIWAPTDDLAVKLFATGVLTGTVAFVTGACGVEV